ncbi:MAG: DUF3667 domain-containing protein [Ferruginibacter sp.]
MSEELRVCKNCGNQFSGKYCNQCGEKVYTEHDKSIIHFFEEALHFISHFEGTFFVTLRTILTKPGKLSLDYCNGLRKKYFKPLPFFMLLVILYLIFPFFTGLNMPFKFYLRNDYANKMIAARTGVNGDSLYKAIEHATLDKGFKTESEAFIYSQALSVSVRKNFPKFEQLESTFNRKSEKVSKFLLLILLPLTALVIWILSIRKSHYFFDQLALSTELNSFFILFSYFFVPAIAIISIKLFPATQHLIFRDRPIAILCYSMFGFFSAVAFRRFYNDAWWWSIIKALLTVSAHVFIVNVIYKFILFALTFYLSV